MPSRLDHILITTVRLVASIAVTVLPAPLMPVPLHPRGARRRRRTLIAAGVIVTVLTPVVTATVLLADEVAVKASKGAECPNCAAYGWVDSIGCAYWTAMASWRMY